MGTSRRGNGRREQGGVAIYSRVVGLASLGCYHLSKASVRGEEVVTCASRGRAFQAMGSKGKDPEAWLVAVAGGKSPTAASSGEGLGGHEELKARPQGV